VEPLERVFRAGKHLLLLITELLDLSKIEAGRMQLVLENVDVLSLVSDAVATTRPLAAANGNTVVQAVDDEVGRVAADPTRLRQILLNLLANASKFTHKGTISVSAHRHTTARDDEIVIDVSDTGIGIPEDMLEQVFGEFTQVDSSMSRPYGGTGLGLTISRKLARLMGGDIHVRSVLHQGSTFTLRIPSGLTAPSPIAADAPPPFESGGVRGAV
jgi:signal transduction histidine kinase